MVAVAVAVVPWKLWAWQLGGGILAVIVIELVLNQFSMTMLPWR